MEDMAEMEQSIARPEVFPVFVSKDPLGTPDINISSLFFTLFDLSSKRWLLDLLETMGLHGLVDVTAGICDSFCCGDGTLDRSTEEVLSRLGQESFERVVKIMRFWKNLRFSTKDKAVVWISSPSCDAARRESMIASLLLLRLLPITEEGKIAMLLYPSSDRVFEEAKRSLIQASEWRDDQLELGQ